MALWFFPGRRLLYKIGSPQTTGPQWGNNLKFYLLIIVAFIFHVATFDRFLERLPRGVGIFLRVVTHR